MSRSDAVVVFAPGESSGAAPAGLEELLVLGRRAQRNTGWDLHCASFANGVEALREPAARHGAAALHRIGSGGGELGPDGQVEALARYCLEQRPRLLLLHQSFDARLLAPRLAARTGSAVVMNAVDLEVEADGGVRITASAYGGDTRVVYALAGTGCPVVGVMTSAVVGEPSPTAGSDPVVRDVAVDLGCVAERVRVLTPARREGPRLEDAECIVAGGRGLGAPENYKLVEQLAEALGGMAGASRPIVDDGWVDSSRQIGLTGKITRPVLYIAVGISGASQHMAGCSAARTLVAVNRDPDAAIFRYARYGVVGDCVEILPALIHAAGRS